jgi:hypothetical protein
MAQAAPTTATTPDCRSAFTFAPSALKRKKRRRRD